MSSNTANFFVFQPVRGHMMRQQFSQSAQPQHHPTHLRFRVSYTRSEQVNIKPDVKICNNIIIIVNVTSPEYGIRTVLRQNVSTR